MIWGFYKMIKKIFVGTIVLAVMFCMVAFAQSKSVKKVLYYRDIKIVYNGEEFVDGKNEPFIIDGSVFLPLRNMAELLGCEVSWDDKNSTVDIKNEKIIDEFLNDKKTFVDCTTGEICTLTTLQEINSAYFNGVSRYAEVDFDGDGVNEYVIEFNSGGNTAILKRYMNDVWYAFYIPYRGILNLKTDGTMLGSNGASNGSIHYVRFTESGLEYDDIVKWDDYKGEYEICGKACTGEEWRGALKLQDAKRNVIYTTVR